MLVKLEPVRHLGSYIVHANNPYTGISHYAFVNMNLTLCMRRILALELNIMHAQNPYTEILHDVCKKSYTEILH